MIHRLASLAAAAPCLLLIGSCGGPIFDGDYGYSVVGTIMLSGGDTFPSDAELDVRLLSDGEPIEFLIAFAQFDVDGAFRASMWDNVSGNANMPLVAPDKPIPNEIEVTVALPECDLRIVLVIDEDTVEDPTAVVPTSFSQLSLLTLTEPLVLAPCE